MTNCYSAKAGEKNSFAQKVSILSSISRNIFISITMMMMCLISLNTNAQISLYTFNQSTESYTPISGTVLATATATSGATTSLDSYIATISSGSFPFPFNFNGIDYTGANMSSNGFITFGSTAPTTTLTTPISSTTAYAGAISAWAGDLNAVFHTSPAIAGSMIWGVTGNAPNRMIVFEWRDFRPAYTTSTINVYRMNFQIRLHETTNVVSIIYGTPQEFVIGSTVISGTRQIGLRGAAATDYNNRTNTTSVLFTSSTPGASNSATQAFNTNVSPGMPSTGLTYTWTPPSCFPPSGLNASNLTPTSGQLNWTAPSIGTPLFYEYEVRTSGAPGSGATGLVTSGTQTHPSVSALITGLTANTSYAFYLRTTCDNINYTAWTAASNFITPCIALTVLPWNDGIEGIATTGAGLLPSCWSFTTITGTNPGTSNVVDNNREPRTGTKYIYTPWNSTSWIFTPPMELISGTSYDFSFYMRNKTVTSPVDFVMDVAYGSSPSVSGMTNVLLSNYSATNSQWTLFKYTIVPSSTGTYYFGIKSTSTTTTPWYLSFDDFKIETTPACYIPLGEGVNNITSNSADFFWSNPSSGSTPLSYEWEVRTSGAPGSGINGLAASGTTNYPTTVATVSGLNSVTTHSFYVRTNCGGGTFSSWAGPINFLTSNPAVPNDVCSASIPLTVNPTLSCSDLTPGSVAGATASNQFSGCFGTADDDVWFSFVATSTAHTISLLNVSGSTTDLYHSVYSGTCISPGAPIVCSDPDNSLASNLTIGNTYYIRVYTYTATPSQTTTFNICVGTPPLPPVNDECVNAINLSVNSDLNCTNITPGTIAWSTGSIGATGCSGTADDDVWFSFVATATSHKIDLLNVAGSTTDLYHVVYSGTCGSLGTPLLCSDPNSSLVSGLTIGNTYFLRVYTWTSTAGQTTTFNVCVSTPPPPPVNDECINAISLTVNPDLNCSSVSPGTVISSTASTGATGCFGTADDDVWFSFVATASTHYINLLNVAGSTTDLYHVVYSGTCGSLGSPLICSDPNNSTVTGLSVGSTYYIRVYTYTSTPGQTTTFNICVGTMPPPPVNDDCINAISLVVNNNFNCDNVTSGSVIGATASNGSTGCSGTADDDVWYSFTATATTHTISLINVSGSTTDLYHAVYSGSCVNPGTPVLCSDPNNSTLNGLTIGNTYLIRVYTYTSTPGQTTNFQICIGSFPPTPVNDECGSALTLILNPDMNCTNFTAGTIASSTASPEATGCNGTADDDVWYSFVATSTVHYIQLLNVIGSTTDLYHAVYAGSCGSVGSPLICSDPNSSLVAGLVIGQTYLLRIYTWTSTPGQTTSFNVCISTPPPGPSNDDCSGAIALTVNESQTCITVTPGTVEFATPSSGATGCFGTADDDVWFSFIATSSVHTINLNNVTGSVTDMYHAVYAGNCGNLSTPIVCSDPNSSTVTGLTPGNIYYIRVYTYTSTPFQNTTFNMCVGTIPPPNCIEIPISPANSSTGICPGSVILSWPTVSGATGYDIYLGTSNNPAQVSFNQTGTTYQANVNPNSTYYWQVIPRNNGGQALGCTSWTFSTTGPEISVSTNGSNVICDGANTISLSATGAENYIWSPSLGVSATTGSSVIASPQTTTTYIVTGTAGNCNATAMVTVLVINTTAPQTNGYSICENRLIPSGQGLTATCNSLNPILLSEDFNGSANGWTTQVSGVGGSQSATAWTLRTSPYTPGGGWVTSSTINSNDNSQFYMTDSDLGGSSQSYTLTTLQSPSFSTIGYSNLTLNYYNYYRYWNTNDTVQVQVSVNGGGWTTVKTYSPSDAGSYSNFSLETVSLDNFVNQSNVSIRFRYRANWGYGWAIDNLTVSGTSTAGLIKWYDAPTGGNLLYTGSTFDPIGNGNLISPTAGAYTYYARCVTMTCESLGTPAVLEVRETPVPIITSSTSLPMCMGETTTLFTQYAAPGYLISWDAGVYLSDEITVAAPGEYSVVVTSPDGCTSSMATIVVETATIFADLGLVTDASCNGGNDGSVEILAFGTFHEPSFDFYPGPFNYGVNGGPIQSSPIFTGLSAGSYTFEVHDPQTGCVSYLPATVGEPDPLVFNPVVINQQVSCNGLSNGSATVSATGGVGPYTYSWNTPLPKQSAENNELPAGTWAVTVMDANGCTATASVTMTQPDPLVAVVSEYSNISCNGAVDGSATISVTGGTAPFTGTGVFTNLTEGTHTFNVTDANGCASSVTVTISEPLPVSVNATSTDVTCHDAANGTITVDVPAGVNYTINGNAPAANYGPGTYEILAQVPNGDGTGFCTATATVTITQPAALQATSASQFNVSCNGLSNGSVMINVAGGTAQYTGTGLKSDLAAGTHTFTVTDANGCTSSVSVTITQPAALNATSASQVNVSCNGGSNGSVIINATGGTAPYTGIGLKAGLAAGTYSYTVTDANGCSASISVSITEPQVLAITLNSSNSTYWNANNGTAQASVTGGTTPYQYLWSNGATTSYISNLTPGAYIVTVTDVNGCTTSGSVLIEEPQYTCSGNASHVKWGQGGWGGTPSGTNPATYLYANFAAAFPNGLRVGHAQGMAGGCNRSILLNTPQAVTAFLPSTGTPRQLNTGHMTNPTAAQYGNTFASQVVALTINVMFDAFDPNFSPASTVALGDMLVSINNSPYNNWTVNALLIEANKILACGGNKNQISAVSDAVDKVNNLNGATKCPGAPTAKTIDGGIVNANNNLKLNAYPNPTSGNVTVEFETTRSINITLSVMDLSGRVMISEFINGEEGKNTHSFDLSAVAKGIYIVRLSNDNVSETLRLVVH